MARVMVEEEMGGFTYSVQYTTENKEILQQYYDENSPKLRSGSNPFEGKFVVFRTEMKVIEEIFKGQPKE